MAFFAKKQVFLLESLLKSKLPDLESYFRAQNTRKAMHCIMKELTSGLFQRCPIPLNIFQGAFSEVKNTSRRHVIDENWKH